MAKINYIDNKRFHKILVERREQLDKAEKEDTQPPVITQEMGDNIIQIATRFGSKSNFAKEPFIDEMILDAIENCILYFDNYKCYEYHNPLAYYTQMCYFAFLRRIGKEKLRTEKMRELKDQYVGQDGAEAFYTDKHDDASQFYKDIEYLQD